MAKQPARTYFKDEESLKKLGAKIREARAAIQVSQEWLANECEVDQSQIGRMERGTVNFRISLLFKIASALHIDAKELLP